MSRLVVKVGGAVAAALGERRARAGRGQRRVRRPRRGPADLGRDGARRDPGRVRRRPAGHDARGARGRAAPRSQHVNDDALRRDRRARRAGSSATRSASQADPVPELGLVGEARPSRRCRCSRGCSTTGKIPVVAPVAAGPLNVNADSAAAAIASGLARRPAALPHRRRRADPRRRGRRLASTSTRPRS